MGVYNGADYLPEQLQSFVDQTHSDWRLYASDDDSKDASARILADFAAAHPGRVQIARGPCAGHVQNYLSMLRNLPDEPGWVAFSDQDDVWLADKLKHGLAELAPHSQGVAMHFSRTWVVAQDLTGRKLSAPRPRPPSFRNALVQNIASGNTILLTPRAAAILVKAARSLNRAVVHDWFIYQVITGCGGVALHDDRPALLYRQHGANSIGANEGLRAAARRFAMIWAGVYADWNATNLAALDKISDDLTPEARHLVAGMKSLRSSSNPIFRVRMLRQLGLYRQTIQSQIVLYFTAFLGKI